MSAFFPMYTAAQILNSLNCPQQELYQYCSDWISRGNTCCSFQLAALASLAAQPKPASCLPRGFNVSCGQSLRADFTHESKFFEGGRYFYRSSARLRFLVSCCLREKGNLSLNSRISPGIAEVRGSVHGSGKELVTPTRKHNIALISFLLLDSK